MSYSVQNIMIWSGLVSNYFVIVTKNSKSCILAYFYSHNINTLVFSGKLGLEAKVTLYTIFKLGIELRTFSEGKIHGS